ncbi:MAG TPA: helix-turn-helix domain-containing protein [Ktedonobacteraceae bacterium]|nr:helix-turn-helix domain-containing protein [Ktedonobacteraceae bacterium]
MAGDVEETEYLTIPGYVPVKIAAKMLNLSPDRITQHVRSGRFNAKKVGGRYLIPKQEVEDFKRNPPGRVRMRAPKWRQYDSRVRLLNIDIRVNVRAGMQERLEQKLQEIFAEQTHKFAGTMERYVFRNLTDPDRVTITLLWKSNEMPDEAIRDRDMAAFRAELADVLDWDTAEIAHNEGLLYT